MEISSGYLEKVTVCMYPDWQHFTPTLESTVSLGIRLRPCYVPLCAPGETLREGLAMGYDLAEVVESVYVQ